MAEYDLNELQKIYENKDVLNYLEQHGILEIKKFNDVYDYEKELYELQVKLLKLQYEIIEKGKRAPFWDSGIGLHGQLYRLYPQRPCLQK